VEKLILHFKTEHNEIFAFVKAIQVSGDVVNLCLIISADARKSTFRRLA
jgi:hypothetical protein